MKQIDAFDDDDVFSTDWRRVAERHADEAAHMRAFASKAERALLEVLALVTAGSVEWHPDMPTTPDHPTGHVVANAGAVLEELQRALGVTS